MQKQKVTAKENKLPGIMKGIICGAAAIFLLMLLGSFLITKFTLPPSSASLMLIPILLLGGGIGGLAASASLKKDGLVTGAMVGGALAFIELCAVFIATGDAPSGNAITKGVILLVSAMIGGIIGVNLKLKKR